MIVYNIIVKTKASFQVWWRLINIQGDLHIIEVLNTLCRKLFILDFVHVKNPLYIYPAKHHHLVLSERCTSPHFLERQPTFQVLSKSIKQVQKLLHKPR